MKKLEDRVRELERMLGRKAMEVEILSEALSKADSKKTDIAVDLVAEGWCPMKTVAGTLGVSRSNLIERLKGRSKLRPCYNAEDAELLPVIRRLVYQRPTYGYRRIAAHLTGLMPNLLVSDAGAVEIAMASDRLQSFRPPLDRGGITAVLGLLQGADLSPGEARLQ